MPRLRGSEAGLGALGAAVLGLSGLAASFGAASCCALPLLLGGLGISGAWFGALALLAAPYRAALLAAAVLCLAASGGLWLRLRRAARSEGATCERPPTTALIGGAICLGAVLTVLGFVFA